jgi:hypothetical protein
MKKAGIVVGVTLIALACFIFWLVGNKDSKKPEGVGVSPAPSSSVQISAPVNPKDNGTTPVAPPVQPVQPVPQQPQPVPAVPVQTQPQVESPKQVFMEFDESQVEKELGKPLSTRKELMIVAKKKIVLMDSNVTAKDNKQLVYAVDLLGNNNSTRLTLYLNGASYAGVGVGDRLQVEYSLYKNTAGVEFPVVINAEKSQ